MLALPRCHMFTAIWTSLFVLRFYGPVNTIKVMSSQLTLRLSTLLLDRLPKRLTSTKSSRKLPRKCLSESGKIKIIHEISGHFRLG